MTALKITDVCFGLVSNTTKLGLQIKMFVSEVHEARRDMDAINRDL